MGNVLAQMWDQSLPPKSKFKVEDMPDLTGKVIIVTGGNSGVGRWTVKALLNKNAKVYIAARNKKRVDEANVDIKQATGREALFLECDLANLKSVKKAAETFLNQEKQLHVLFNNGGVMIPPIEQKTADGYDLQFGTNVLGHWYLTVLLLPVLIETAKTNPDGKARIVNTSSSAAMFNGSIDYNTVKPMSAADEKARSKKGTQQLYAQSKFGNVVVSNELAKRYGDQGIASTALNPGNLRTDLQRHLGGFLRRILNLTLYEASKGALTQLWAGTMPETRDFNGKYLIPWARVGTIRPETRDPKIGQDLWAWCEEQVKNV